MRQKEIETKIAFQEQTIKNLNDVLCEQLQEIERLDSICDALVKRVKNSQSLPRESMHRQMKSRPTINSSTKLIKETKEFSND